MIASILLSALNERMETYGMATVMIIITIIGAVYYFKWKKKN